MKTLKDNAVSLKSLGIELIDNPKKTRSRLKTYKYADKCFFTTHSTGLVYIERLSPKVAIKHLMINSIGKDQKPVLLKTEKEQTDRIIHVVSENLNYMKFI